MFRKLLFALAFGGTQLASATNDVSARSSLFDLLQEVTPSTEQTRVLKDVPAGDAQRYVNAEVIIPGAGEWEVDVLRCEQALPFVVTGPGQRGTIWVAKCSTQLALARKLPERAHMALGKLVTEIQGNKVPEVLSQAKKSLNQATLHYFPVVLVGHGLLILPTAMLISKEEVFVVQFQLENCDDPEKFSICKNSRDLVQDIAAKAQSAFAK